MAGLAALVRAVAAMPYWLKIFEARLLSAWWKLVLTKSILCPFGFFVFPVTSSHLPCLNALSMARWREAARRAPSLHPSVPARRWEQWTLSCGLGSGANPRLSVCLLINIFVFSPLGPICLSIDLCLCASSWARHINFLPLGVSDALRLCNKRNSRVLTSLQEIYHHPVKESEAGGGNGSDQRAERLLHSIFFQLSVGLLLMCPTLPCVGYCVYIISPQLMILTVFSL